LDQYRGNDSRSRPVASTWWHLEEPLFQRELANLSYSAIFASKKRRHDPGNNLKEGKKRSVEVLQEFGGLKDAIDGTENALA
jgi:hypothetical protein